MSVSEIDSRRRVRVAQTWNYVVQARNAIVVFGAALLAYVLHVYNITPFALTGELLRSCLT
jgi:hypothetical protein